VVGPPIAVANGIDVDADGRRLYVASSRAGRVRAFSIAADGALPPEGEDISIDIGGTVDNLSWSKDRLYVTSYSWLMLLLNGQFRSMSGETRVFEFNPKAPTPTAIGTVPGGELSTGSVVVRFGDRFYFGQVSNYGVLSCGAHQPRVTP
jgi:sugar lactone lactonase YvrE